MTLTHADGTFLERLNSIADTATRRFAEPAISVPPLLYHYTNARGLIGIVDAKELWATDARFLNDATELDHVREVVAAAASSVAEHVHTPHARMLCDRLRLIESTDVFLGSAYIASFSANPDLLSQWRAYGDDGLGYAVGVSSRFQLEVASRDAETKYPPAVLRKVAYEPKAPGGRLWDSIVECVALVDSLEDVGATERTDLVYASILTLLRDVYPSVKNHGFSEEDEWRVVFWNHAMGGYLEPLRFRPNGQGIAPYVALRWKLEQHQPPVEEIVMGPRIPQVDGESALFMMLLAHGYSAGCGELKVALRHSKVSYRR
jgi:Protein of unknown function (DUF2971)